METRKSNRWRLLIWMCLAAFQLHGMHALECVSCVDGTDCSQSCEGDFCIRSLIRGAHSHPEAYIDFRGCVSGKLINDNLEPYCLEKDDTGLGEDKFCFCNAPNCNIQEEAEQEEGDQDQAEPISGIHLIEYHPVSCRSSETPEGSCTGSMCFSSFRQEEESKKGCLQQPAFVDTVLRNACVKPTPHMSVGDLTSLKKLVDTETCFCEEHDCNGEDWMERKELWEPETCDVSFSLHRVNEVGQVSIHTSEKTDTCQGEFCFTMTSSIARDVVPSKGEQWGVRKMTGCLTRHDIDITRFDNVDLTGKLDGCYKLESTGIDVEVCVSRKQLPTTTTTTTPMPVHRKAMVEHLEKHEEVKDDRNYDPAHDAVGGGGIFLIVLIVVLSILMVFVAAWKFGCIERMRKGKYDSVAG